MFAKRQLLRFRLKKDRTVVPGFLSLQQQSVVDFVSYLLPLLKNMVGQTRQEVETVLSQAQEMFDVHPDVALGFMDIILKDCCFNPPIENAVERRHQMFLASKQALEKTREKLDTQYGVGLLQRFGSPQDNAVLDHLYLYYKQQLGADTQQLYADLPDWHVLTQAPDLADTVEQAIDRYNLCLAQGFICHSQKVVLHCKIHTDKDRALLRKMIAQAKFFKIVMHVQSFSDQHMELVFEGPLAVLQHTQKYGVQLASFFPQILFLQNWSIQADVVLSSAYGPRLQRGSLVLDHTALLRSSLSQASWHTPEEFRLFEELFLKTNSDWLLESNQTIVGKDGVSLFFPDYILSHKKTHVRYFLELFHSWHKGAAHQRLRFYKDIRLPGKLIIGLSQKLVQQDKALSTLLAQGSGDLIRPVFLFKDMPRPKELLKTLELIENPIEE